MDLLAQNFEAITFRHVVDFCDQQIFENRLEKASLSLAIDGKNRLGQLTVWNTGEAELECAEVATGNVRREHRDLASALELQIAYQELIEWLNAASPKRRRRYGRRRKNG